MSFENASVTKGLMMACALSSLLVGIFDIKHYFHMQFVPHISRHHQYWRLLSHQLAFPNSTDLFLGEILLYNVGIHVERQFGGLKYASFLFVSTIVSTVLEFMVLVLFHRVGLNHFAMGPAPLVLSIVYQYSRIVPAVYNYRIFGIPLNNKSMNYFLALLIACSRPPASLAIAVIGVLTGQIYRSDLASLNTYRLPPSLVGFARRFSSPLIGSLRPPRRSNRALPDDFRSVSGRSSAFALQEDEVITTARTPRTARGDGEDGNAGATPSPSVMREWVDELTGRTDRATAGLRVATEEEITQVTSMFPSLDREIIVAALQRSPNIEAAVETLLTSQN